MSDQPQYSDNDSPLDKSRYKNIFEETDPCDDSTDPELIDISVVWCCVYLPLDDTFECVQKTLVETLGTDLEVYSTKEECERKSQCVKRFYCEYNVLEGDFICNEKQIARASGLVGYYTADECEDSCSDTKWYCEYDSVAASGPVGIDPESSNFFRCVPRTVASAMSENPEAVGYNTEEECKANCTDTKYICVFRDQTLDDPDFKCIAKAVGQILAEDPPETVLFDSKEECEENGDCEKKYWCFPSSDNVFAGDCRLMTRGEAHNPITGDPEAVGYDTLEECEDNCPYPTETPTPTPTPTSTPTPTEPKFICQESVVSTYQVTYTPGALACQPDPVNDSTPGVVAIDASSIVCGNTSDEQYCINDWATNCEGITPFIDGQTYTFRQSYTRWRIVDNCTECDAAPATNDTPFCEPGVYRVACFSLADNPSFRDLVCACGNYDLCPTPEPTPEPTPTEEPTL